jgi:hypothetical protein
MGVRIAEPLNARCFSRANVSLPVRYIALLYTKCRNHGGMEA